MQSFETPGPISATVELPIGDLRIEAGERATTTVEVRPSDPSNAEDRQAAEQTRVEYAEDRLLVKVPKLRTWRPRREGGSVDVTVALPAGSNVEAKLALADVTCQGRLFDCRVKTGLGRIEVEEAGTVNVHSGAGDIRLERASGRVEVTTGSGELRLSALDGGGVVKSSNGDIWIGTAGGELRVKAANGSIAIEQARGDVEAKSSNGDVRLGAAAGGAVVLETALGDVEAGIPEGVAAWLDLDARAGRVRNALDAAEAPEPSTEAVRIRARTGLGDIAIRRPALA